METSFFWVNLLVGLCVRSAFAFPPKHYTQHELLQGPPIYIEQQKAPAEEPEHLNTVRVTCHPDVFEIVIKADMFGVGAPVSSDELRLGVEHIDYCRAITSSGDDYVIIARLTDCGTKHWMTEDSLVYTNLLMYSPVASPDGLIRMEDAVIPVECHYERKYSLSSSSLTPTWIPFMSTQAAVETLDFNLRVMTNDWQYERSSNVYHLGDHIPIEASVRVGHHIGLRVFISSCVATLDPDIYSVPRYIFIENGCLVDSQLPGSKSQFFSRIQDDKLYLVIDAFRFHEEDRGELYITCHLNAVPVNDAQATNKACTYINGRWRSADGNDYLCGQCQNQNEVEQTYSLPGSPGKFSPRGFGKPAEPEASWGDELKTKVWDQEARVGPMLVLPATQRSGPLPVEELPPLLNKISRPALYGSQWRSGLKDSGTSLEKGLLPDPSDDVEDEDFASEQDEDFESGKGLTDGDTESEVDAPLVTLNSEEAPLDNNSTAALSDVSPTALTVDVTTLSNATTTDSDLSDIMDPKR